MNYATIKNLDIANGPGIRVSLFVSGCRRHCPGCFNQEAQSFEYGKLFTHVTLMRLGNLLSNEHIKGLSILGGDPLEPENRDTVETICQYMRTHYPDKDIWLWTGYLWEDVKDWSGFKYVDVLVDGPFIEELKDLTLYYRGSSNQRVIDVQKSLAAGCAIQLEGDWK